MKLEAPLYLVTVAEGREGWTAVTVARSMPPGTWVRTVPRPTRAEALATMGQCLRRAYGLSGRLRVVPC